MKDQEKNIFTMEKTRKDYQKKEDAEFLTIQERERKELIEFLEKKGINFDQYSEKIIEITKKGSLEDLKKHRKELEMLGCNTAELFKKLSGGLDE